MKMNDILFLTFLLLAFGCGMNSRFRDVFVFVDSSNAFKIEKEVFDSNSISNKLSDLSRKNPGRTAIHFVCDAQQPFAILNKVFDPAIRLGIWRFTLRTSPDAPPVDCARPAPDPSGGRVYSYMIRVYPNHFSINGANSTLAQIITSLQGTGNNYVTVIPKEDVNVKQMYDILRSCETNSKVLSVYTIDYETENDFTNND